MGTKNTLAFESWIDTHEQPFVVIDRDFRIVAVNRAYQNTYGLGPEDIVGRYCYETHDKDRPCFELGEDCPHQEVFASGERCSCARSHFDRDGRAHRVRVTGYPLRDGDGNLYLGELQQELAEPAELASQGRRMVGQSVAFLRTLEQLKMASASDSPVLLQGETGTGKDLAANFIHRHSHRRGKCFLTLDCTVLTESLFEAEVFGYERGAFTGSVGEKEGLFELADGGTLFLDEIGEIPPHLQAKLLRALETGQYRRIGGRETRQTNARIICATNRNLGRDVGSKSFREDLYYRIACLHVQMPSLRERLQDIPLLAETLIEDIGARARRVYRLSRAALFELQTYPYPGNIRELRNILSVAAAHCTGTTIDASDVAAVIRATKSRRHTCGEQLETAPPAELEPALERDTDALEKLHAKYLAAVRERKYASYLASIRSNDGRTSTADDADALEDLEAEYITALLRHKRGNRREAAAALGMSERTLYRRLRRYGLA